jgi:hypothetical protein
MMQHENIEQQTTGLSLSFGAENYLLTASRWAKFLGVLGFVASGIMAIFGFSFGAIMSAVAALAPTPAATTFPTVFFAVFYLIIAGVYFLIAYYLYNFGSKTHSALLSRSEDLLEDGFKKLKLWFTFLGVMSIIGMAFLALAILGAIVAVFSGAFAMLGA